MFYHSFCPGCARGGASWPAPDLVSGRGHLKRRTRSWGSVAAMGHPPLRSRSSRQSHQPPRRGKRRPNRRCPSLYLWKQDRSFPEVIKLPQNDLFFPSWFKLGTEKKKRKIRKEKILTRGEGALWVVYVEQEGVDFILKTSWLSFVSLTLSLHYVIICKTIMYLLHKWPFLTSKRHKCGLKLLIVNCLSQLKIKILTLMD